MADNAGRRRLAKIAVPRVSQSEIAQALGVAPSTVCNWLAGRSKPGDDARARLERLYGISPASWDRP